MNAYDELAGFRFTPGRDYDKRSVEMFRARAMNVVDDLLDQVTSLRDEVAALRAAGHDAPPAQPVARLEPASSWLTTSAGGSFPPPFIAPPTASAPQSVAGWVSAIENPPTVDGDGDDDEGRESDAERFVGTVELEPTPSASAADDDGNSAWTDATYSFAAASDSWDAWEPEPVNGAADGTDLLAAAPIDAAPAVTSPAFPALFAPIDLDLPPATPSSSTARLLLGRAEPQDEDATRTTAGSDAGADLTTPPSSDIAEAPVHVDAMVAAAVAAAHEPATSPIVIDASPDEVGALPTPVRHWSGWLKR